MADPGDVDHGVLHRLAPLRSSPPTFRGRPATTRIARIPHSQRTAVLLRHHLPHTPNFRHGYKGRSVRSVHRSART